MKILVVDDDGLAAEMTVAILEGAGHEVLLSENGLDALEKLAADPELALVVSDLNMPLMSGIELFREIRGQGKRLPFILLTADEPAKVQADAPDLEACVTKDFSLQEVLPELVARLSQR